MTRATGSSEIGGSRKSASPAPLLVTAELPPDLLGWADAMRRAHYPPERNRLRAHVTLFHMIPPSAEGELFEILVKLGRRPPPPARIDGLMKLQQGTALAVKSPAMTEMYADISYSLHGLLAKQNVNPARLHITIQNKVSATAARSLHAQLAPAIKPVEFRFYGFGVYAWEEGLWREIRKIPFRG